MGLIAPNVRGLDKVLQADLGRARTIPMVRTMRPPGALSCVPTIAAEVGSDGDRDL